MKHFTIFKKISYVFLTTILVVIGLFFTHNAVEAKIAWNIPSIFPASKGGKTWTYMVASSDGAILYAYKDAGYIYKSIDSGYNWTILTPLGSRAWSKLDTTPNGQTLVASVGSSGNLYISTDAGVSWTTDTSSLGTKNWSCSAVSDDGTTIIGATTSDNKVYVSTTSGSSWVNATGGGLNIFDCDVSADGLNFVLGLTSLSPNTNVQFSPTANISLTTVSTNMSAFSQVRVSYIGDNAFVLGPVSHNSIYKFSSTGTLLSTSTISIIEEISGLAPTGYKRIVGSSDANILYLKSSSDFVYSSVDNGVSWEQDSEDGSIFNNLYTQKNISGDGIAVSADGTKIYTGVNRGLTSFTPPSFSSVSDGVSTSTIDIVFNTSVQASTTTEYGLSENNYTESITTSSGLNSWNFNDYGTTTHSITLSGLLACTTYNYKYNVLDIFENTATSPNYSAKTLGCMADAAPIQSQSVTVANSGVLTLNNLSVVIPDGFSNTVTTAQFEATELETETVMTSIPAPASYRSFGSLYQIQAMPTATTNISNFDTPISIVLTYDPNSLDDIDPSNLSIFSTEGDDWTELNSCVIDTDENTVICETSHFSTFGIFGLTDPSVISNINTSKTKTSATITWNTNKGSTTQINWGTNSDVANSLIEDETFGSTTHSVSLSDLTEGTTYYFQIVSIDADSNTTLSSIMSFKTDSSRSSGSSVSSRIKNLEQNGNPEAAAELRAQFPNTPTTLPTTIEGLKALLASLQAQLAQLMGTPSQDLELNSEGPAVTALQNLLISKGYTIPAGATGFFGPQTQQALIKFQQEHNITPAAGYYGVKTRGVMGGL